MWITLATDANWSAAVPSLRGWQHHITSPVHPEFQMRQRRLALPLQEQVDGGVDLPQAGLVGGEAPQGACNTPSVNHQYLSLIRRLVWRLALRFNTRDDEILFKDVFNESSYHISFK
jgi:hypothetical protein